MTEQIRSLEEMVNSERDPHTIKLLKLMQRWWKPSYGFYVPRRNYLGIEGGCFYNRDELYPIMVGGYKPGMDPKVRESLVQTSKTIFEAMLLCDDGNPLFEVNWRDSLDRIDG